MAIKPNQLKKFSVKALKKIVKDNKLGKITKKKKAQLVAMIMDAENMKVIISSLNMPVKAKRKFSDKQIAAQQKFANRNRKKNPGSIKRGAGKIKEGSPLDKTIKKVKGLFGGNPATFSPTKIKANVDIEDVVDAIDIPVKMKDVKKLVKVAEEVADEIKANPTKEFLDEIFGIEVFNFENEIIKIVNEMEDDNKLNKFLSLSKNKIKSLLMKKFNSAMSIQQFINSI